VGVLAGDPPTRQRQGNEVRHRILRHRHLQKRSVELLEAMVDNGADELGDSTEVVVNHHRRQPACGCHRTRLDGGRSLLGQQPDRGVNDPLRHTIGRRIPRRFSHAST
jgi:hypothetical protein